MRYVCKLVTPETMRFLTNSLVRSLPLKTLVLLTHGGAGGLLPGVRGFELVLIKSAGTSTDRIYAPGHKLWSTQESLIKIADIQQRGQIGCAQNQDLTLGHSFLGGGSQNYSITDRRKDPPYSRSTPHTYLQSPGFC